MIFLNPEFWPSATWVTLTLISLVLAELLRIWAVGYAGSQTRTRADSVGKLVYSGPYRHVRNPLYIANILLYSLCGFLFGFRLLSLAVLVYSAIQYHFIVKYEEEVLLRTFGTEYENYCNGVPRWLPQLTSSYPSSSQQFSLRKALRSERSTLIAMAAMGIIACLRIWLLVA